MDREDFFVRGLAHRQHLAAVDETLRGEGIAHRVEPSRPLRVAGTGIVTLEAVVEH